MMRRYLPFVIGAAVILWIVFIVFNPGSGNGEAVSYSLFVNQVKAGNVSEVTLSDNSVTGTFKKAVHSDTTSDTETKFNTNIPNLTSEETVPLLTANGVKINVSNSDSNGFWLTLIGYFGPVLLIGLAFWWLMRRSSQAQGGIFSF